MGQGKRTAGLWFFRLTLTLRYWPELQADTKPPGPYYENNADSRKRQLGKLSETLYPFGTLSALLSRVFLPFIHSMGKMLNYNQE